MTGQEAPVGPDRRGYLTLLLMAGLLGIPLSLVAFVFLVVVHELEHLVWHDLPELLGYEGPPAWWPILTIGVAGGVVALAVRHLPGRAGHPPVEGVGAGATRPVEVPGVVIAAVASLVGGAVVGPEAPLIAIGSGLALLAIRRTRRSTDPSSATILAAAGSAAAISAIFGNPLVAAVIFLEVLGLARPQLMFVVLPCLLSSGVGGLLFTGLGRWSGFEIGALAIPDLVAVRLGPWDVVWTVPLACGVALGTALMYAVGRRVSQLATSRLLVTTVGAGLVAGLSACVYALVSDRSPAEVALSGQATLPLIASDGGAWPAGTLLALVLCKGIAYAVCLGTFRGGPVFPAIVLGAAGGALAASVLPGLTPLSALAIGMAAGMAVTGMPVTSVVLVVLLLGDAASTQMPVVILSVVVALVVQETLSGRLRHASLPAESAPVTSGAAP